MEAVEAIILRLRDQLPANVRVAEREAAYQAGIAPGVVTVAVSSDAEAGNSRLAPLGVDVDVFEAGPSAAKADALARGCEAALDGWSVETAHMGRVRLFRAGSLPVDSPDRGIAHISLRFNGRGFRRLES